MGAIAKDTTETTENRLTSIDNVENNEDSMEAVGDGVRSTGENVKISENKLQSANDESDQDVLTTQQTFIKFAREGDTEKVLELLQSPEICIDGVDKDGLSALKHAAFKGRRDVCELLLLHGADVNTTANSSGYTSLMFAALSGSVGTTQLLLDAGARTDVVNSVDRTAAQMAAFVGRHDVVSCINNHFPLQELERFSLESSSVSLDSDLVAPLYTFMLLNYYHPVKFAIYLQQHPALLRNRNQVYAVLCEASTRQMKLAETNEILGLKFHYMSQIFRHICDIFDDKMAAGVTKWIKQMLRNPGDVLNHMVQGALKTYPNVHASQVARQAVYSIASAKGGFVSSLDVLTQALNGQHMPSEEDVFCPVCGSKAIRNCAACKKVSYCDRECQKLHWFLHKTVCQIRPPSDVGEEKKSVPKNDDSDLAKAAK